MSTACEATGSEAGCDASQAISRSQSDDKAPYEEEELDYEEEMEYQSKSNNNLKNEEEEGELSDDTNDEQAQATPVSKDKDEGEIDDDDDLEEGEVKEEEDEGALADTEDSAKVESDPRRNRNFDSQPELRSSTSRPLDNQRYSKAYYSNNYHNSRPPYNSRTNDRYTSSRVRDYNNYTAPPPAPPAASQTESAWERGLKQARELLSKASKRKEEEVDFENKRFNMTTAESIPPLAEVNVQFNNRMRSSREKSPMQKRRRHSPHSSSEEDEVERRHRLAYDAAPWNNPSSSNYQSGNYRSSSRPNYSSSNRSAETYRDPWRRSKSPKMLSSSSMASRSKRPELDTRYGEGMRSRHPPHSLDARDHARYGSNNNGGGGPQRSDSISSLSSIDSHNSSKSPRRKLPYSRPNLEAGNRFNREHDILPGRNDTFSKLRMDRIPKKSNASAHQANDRVSEAKSFDSWSESLSDSESSSFYSDSSDESDVESTSRDPKVSKKLSADKRSQGKSEGVDAASGSRGAKDALSRETHSKTKSVDAVTKRQGREAKKPPIKMTFMKTQTSLKKDRLIDEQLNGEDGKSPVESLADDMETNHSVSSKFSSKSVSNSKSQSEDEEGIKPSVDALPQQVRESNIDQHSSCSSSPTSNNQSEKLNRREALLKKLKQVEEAIERRLNKKKE